MSGLHIDRIAEWLQGVEKIDKFEYYDFMPGAKWPSESESVNAKPVSEVLDFLNSGFTESVDSFVEVQMKAFKSGRRQVIVRKITTTTSKREITKIAALSFKKPT